MSASISENLLEIARSQSEAYIAAYQTGYTAGYSAAIKKAAEMVDKALKPVSLPGHEKPKHWYDANTNGFSDEAQS